MRLIRFAIMLLFPVRVLHEMYVYSATGDGKEPMLQVRFKVLGKLCHACIPVTRFATIQKAMRIAAKAEEYF